MGVGLVAVSHSERIALGVVELAAQMAGETSIVAAGGTDEGGIGTSFDKVTAAIERAQSGDGVVILTDLGSAVLTAETALDLLDEEQQALVRIVDAPLVEGAVAAAVAAETGGDLDAVVAAAETAAGGGAPAEPASAAHGAADDVGATDAATAARSIELINPSGLHARPAAELVRVASTFDATVTVNGVDGKSLLRIMALGLDTGATVELQASGKDAEAAIAALGDLVASGFGEV